MEPPIGIGMTPLCLLMYLTFLGASWCRNLAPRKESDWLVGDQGQRADCERQTAWAALTLVRADVRRESISVRIPVTRHGISFPPPPSTTMSDRKRAFEGNGDSNVSKKLKRSVLSAGISLVLASRLLVV